MAARESLAELIAREQRLKEQIREARAREAALNKELEERMATALGRVVLTELGDWKGIDANRFRELFAARSEKFSPVVGEELALEDAEKALKAFESSLRKKKPRKKPAETDNEAC